MSISGLIVNVVFVVGLVNVVFSFSSSTTTIVDSEIGNRNLLITCPIDRIEWTLPTILQWYRSTNNFTKPIASQFDDYPVHIDEIYRHRYRLLTNGSLEIENVQLNDNDTFECRLILIDRGLLDVKEKYFIQLRVNEPPRFIHRSDSLQVAASYSTVDLVCRIYGVPIPIVTWYKVALIDDEDLQLLSVNNEHFILDYVDDRMAGKYRCIGKNRLGSIQAEFRVLIKGSIYWRRAPKNQTVKVNGSFTLNCEGESSETLQYQWLKNGLSVSDLSPSQGRIRTYSDGFLVVNHVEPTDHGAYVCVISTWNSTNIRSKPAVITVKYPPTPSITRSTKNLTMIRGTSGVCPCLLEAYPPVESVSWYRNGTAIRIGPKGGAYTINSEYALVIRLVGPEDDGQYFCRAQNSEGFGHDGITFFVETREPIQFILKPNSIYHVHEQESLILPCVVFGHPQPTIRWFKNSVEVNERNANLTLERIQKLDHGLYICQASNEHTKTNVSTLVMVEDTTPQAPLNVEYKLSSSLLEISWEPGYHGGRPQYFIVWYRMSSSSSSSSTNRKQQPSKSDWNQVRVLPENASSFTLFDLQAHRTYELTIVAKNSFGLGSFSPIVSIHLNDNSSIGHLYHPNETSISSNRPLSPIDLHLSLSGYDLLISWHHPPLKKSTIDIVQYVIQWHSTILFDSQQPQQSIVVDYPTRSYLLKDVKQSKYIVQIIAYSKQGIYSMPIESQINIQFNSILAYNGSGRVLISLLCFLTVLTVAAICLGVFYLFKYYYHRRSYCTDIGCGNRNEDISDRTAFVCHCVDSKISCWCFPNLRQRFGQCTHLNGDRYHASLLKTNNLTSASPGYMCHHRITPQKSVPARPPSPSDSFSDSTISIAKVATIPRCRDSLVSATAVTPQLTRGSVSMDNPRIVVSPALTFAGAPAGNDETKMTSFFQPIPVDNASPVPYGEIEVRKGGNRLPLEAVPELSELDVAASRYTFDPASATSLSHHPRSAQPSPILITFDSSSLKRRT